MVLILFPACSGLEFVILVLLGFCAFCVLLFWIRLVFGLKWWVLGDLISLRFSVLDFRGFLF